MDKVEFPVKTPNLSAEKFEKKIMLEYSKAKSGLRLDSKFKDQVLGLYRKLYKKGCIIPRERSANVASLIYIVSRQNNAPILLEDLALIFGVNKKRIFRFLKKNIRALGIHLKPEDPYAFLDRFAKELKIKPKQYKKARDIIKRMKLSGKSIKAMVLSVLAYVADLDPRFISKEYGVSPYTLRKYRKIIEGKEA